MYGGGGGGAQMWQQQQFMMMQQHAAMSQMMQMQVSEKMEREGKRGEGSETAEAKKEENDIGRDRKGIERNEQNRNRNE